MSIKWQHIWEYVAAKFRCDRDSVHGLSRWHRVERYRSLIAARSGAFEEVVRLFAVFHDSCRVHDDWDNTHGTRAAAFAASLRGRLFDLSDEHFERLHCACTWHTHGKLSDDPTMGTCWDVDRLDLGRIGIEPEIAYMSAELGREIAAHGSAHPFLTQIFGKQTAKQESELNAAGHSRERK